MPAHAPRQARRYSIAMAIVPTRATADNPAQVLVENPHGSDSGDYRNTHHVLKNVTATAPIFLGGPNVSDVDGFEWQASDGAFDLDLEPGEQLYGYASVEQDVQVLSGGR